jgi:hypothetical protein
MKNTMWILAVICLIALPSLANSQGTVTTNGTVSLDNVSRDVLLSREAGVMRDGEKVGPLAPIPNVLLSVSSLADLDKIDSYNRSLVFYYDGSTLHVATKLYGPDAAMQPGQTWFLGGYANKAFQMDVTGAVGRAQLPLAPGNYTLFHWVGPSSSPLWTYPLWSCPAYGLRIIGGEEYWGYQITVLANGQVVTMGTSVPS